jgi:hypothetical protein
MTDIERWAARGRWLTEKLSERQTPDGRTVLEIADEPIWCRPDGTLADYVEAVDAAMDADENADPQGPRFDNVSCSQCGQGFGAGDNGYSHCEQHQGART